MRFDKKEQFISFVSQSGLNLFLGAGFSVYAVNKFNESLLLGTTINKKLIEHFGLDKSKNYKLSHTCQKIKKDAPDELKRFLKEVYSVENFDDIYLNLVNLPIKNIFTLNIDDLIEKIFENKTVNKILIDNHLLGASTLKEHVEYFKLHGSVNYNFSEDMYFSIEELYELFVKKHSLFEVVSHELSKAPTLFWGINTLDGNPLNILINAKTNNQYNLPKWIVIYPGKGYEEQVEYYEDLGFNIIEADTKELLNEFKNMHFKPIKSNLSEVDLYKKNFNANYICNELLENSIKRPVIDFFSGAEPIISDILSMNVPRISYYNKVLSSICENNVTLITGIPGCGKSTLLMQLALSNETTGPKFLFINMLKQEAEKLIEISKDKEITVFLDNVYSNIDAYNVLKEYKNVKLVLAERNLNFEYIRKFFSISQQQLIDISNLNSSDIQKLCKSMNKSSNDALSLIRSNENVSLMEIAFFISNNSKMEERIRRYINDLSCFKDEELKIDLLELYTLVNYVSMCGIPTTMDMLYFYFSDYIENYKDIYYALEKMSKIIVEASSENIYYDNSQDCLIMRSKLYAEKSIKLIPSLMLAKVLTNFIKRINPAIIYRYDIFKKKAYDADITKRAFEKKDGIKFYEQLLDDNYSPYIKHQYAIYLQRINEIDLAWQQIDSAYTESEKKIFTIANTHAIILFERNYEISATDENTLKLQKDLIKRSFNTLEYCLQSDARVNYHALIYARHAKKYFDKFGNDENAMYYVNYALNQLKIILEDTQQFIYQGLKNELINLVNCKLKCNR